MARTRWAAIVVPLLLLLQGAGAMAQAGGFQMPPLTRAQAPAEPNAFPLYPAGAQAAAGGAGQETWDSITGDLVVRNAVEPT